MIPGLDSVFLNGTRNKSYSKIKVYTGSLGVRGGAVG